MSSYYEAELAKLRARDQDVDKAVQTGVTAGRGIADYLRMGFQDDLAVQQMDLNKRMQKIQDERAAREKQKFDLDMAKVRTAAEVGKAERAEAAAREKAYEDELARLKAERAEREFANIKYNAEVQSITDKKRDLERQAKELGISLGRGLGVTGEEEGGFKPLEPLPPPEPGLTPSQAALAQLPFVGAPLRRSSVTVAPTSKEGQQLLTGFRAVAPEGYGFDAEGNLVPDLSGGTALATELAVEIPGVDGPEGETSTMPNYDQDKILSDAQIEQAAQDFAAKLELEDTRQVVMEALAADPLNAEFFKLAGESGVAGFIDMAIGENASARSAAAQRAFENALASKDVDNKTKKAAAEGIKALAKVEREVANSKKTQAQIELDKKDLALRERKQVMLENAQRRKFEQDYKAGRELSKSGRDQYKRMFTDAVRRLRQIKDKVASARGTIAGQLQPDINPSLLQKALRAGTKDLEAQTYTGITAGWQGHAQMMSTPEGMSALQSFYYDQASLGLSDAEVSANAQKFVRSYLASTAPKGKAGAKAKAAPTAEAQAEARQVVDATLNVADEQEYLENPRLLMQDATAEQKAQAQHWARSELQEQIKRNGMAALDREGVRYGHTPRAGESQAQKAARRKAVTTAVLNRMQNVFLARIVVSSRSAAK